MNEVETGGLGTRPVGLTYVNVGAATLGGRRSTVIVGVEAVSGDAGAVVK